MVNAFNSRPASKRVSRIFTVESAVPRRPTLPQLFQQSMAVNEFVDVSQDVAAGAVLVEESGGVRRRNRVASIFS